MIILNFSHPLTDEQIKDIENITGKDVTQVINILTQFDHKLPFKKQIIQIIESTGFSKEEWQTLPLIINPPSYSPITACLIAKIHGITGYFPTIIRLRPVEDSIPQKFEVAEIINLQELRDKARDWRNR